MRKMNMMRFLMVLIWLLMIISTVFMGPDASAHTDRHMPVIDYAEYMRLIHPDTVKYERERLTMRLTDEVDSFIRAKAPDAPDDLPECMVRNALGSGIDLCFMMAQASAETNFGTCGQGRRQGGRSLFGVAGRRYGRYEDAVRDWCRLIGARYLTGGRTEKDLMVRFETKGGSRYAADAAYEKKLRRIYDVIHASTEIRDLQARILDMS